MSPALILGLIVFVSVLVIVLLGDDSDKPSDSGQSNKQDSLRDEIPVPNVILSKKFITETETKFFRVLDEAVGDSGHILCQVALNQLLYVPGTEKSNPGRNVWRNKLDRRSVDFVVCDPVTLRPLVALELDDRSHEQPKRQKRDREVETSFEKAGFKLVRVPVAPEYNVDQLRESLGFEQSQAA